MGDEIFVKAYTFKVILSKVKIKAHLRKWNKTVMRFLPDRDLSSA